jgi:ElaB/YqjD/DUF883 family membrane-anchored ribosome-binding protein
MSNGNSNGPNAPFSSPGVSPSDTGQRANEEFGGVADKARGDLDAIRQKASEDVDKLKHQAKDQLDAASQKAKSFAAEQKDLASGQLSGIASAINKVADELDTSNQGVIARYARDLAKGVDQMSETVRNREVDDLIGAAQDFGRKQPVAFLGVAALAGFVASRFVLASAHRREMSSTQSSAQTSRTFTGGQSNNFRAEGSSAYSTGARSPGTGLGEGDNVGS